MQRWKGYSRYTLPIAVGVVALAVMVLSLTIRRSRAPQRQPAPPPPAPAAPRVDPEIARRYASEPTITLFVHEKDQRIQIPLEQYLRGVAAAERSGDMPPQALQALVVAARTITLFNRDDPQAASRISDGADACTSPVHFQAYAPDKVDAAVRAAVQATRGQVLLHGGKPIYAAFSSFAGGRTATAAEAFGGAVTSAPYLQSVDSPITGAAPAREKQWSVTVSKATLLRAVGATSGNVEIVSRGPSGRVLQVRIGNKQISGAELRAIVGASGLRSTLITDLTDTGDKVIFSGRGWGHGAGLDQWGAHGLAQQGRTAAQILAHYYPQTQLAKLYP
ncbi:MAG: SpoIID/LytB domain-containing protein [Bacillota bacterium]